VPRADFIRRKFQQLPDEGNGLDQVVIADGIPYQSGSSPQAQQLVAHYVRVATSPLQINLD
jgi:hypothetical protein